MGKVRIVIQSWKHYWGELKHKRNEEGLTLIELMVVVVILGIIAAVAIPSISNAINSAKVNTTVSDLATFQQALQRYYIDHGNYPPTFNLLDQTTTASGTVAAGAPFGPYLNYDLNQVINDAFGHPIYYAAITSGTATDMGYYLLSGGTTSNTVTSAPSSITAGDIYAASGQAVGIYSQTPTLYNSSSPLAVAGFSGTN